MTFRFNPDDATVSNVFRLPGGTYDVDVFVNDERGFSGVATNTPLRARSGFVASSDTSVTFDVPVFDVVTRLRVDGQDIVDPFESFAEGGVSFKNTVTGVIFRFNPDDATVSNVFRLPGGTYDVDVFVNDERGFSGVATNTPLRAASCVLIGG